MIQPLNDRVLIQRIEEPSAIVLTDAPKGIKGVILSVGPGKWIPGGWWKVSHAKAIEAAKQITCDIYNNEYGHWAWIYGYRQTPEVKPGMTVLFNSKWNDFSAGENKGTGSDFSGPLERPLPLKADPMLHLVQEADIFCILPDSAYSVRASLGRPTLEKEFFINRRVAGPWSEA